MIPKSNLLISQFIPGEERRKFKDIIKVLALVIDLAEGYKLHHGYNVALTGVQLGKFLNLSVNSLRNIFYAGLLHDIGEVGISKEKLKVNLLDWQFNPLLRNHTLIGEKIVSSLPTLEEASHLIRWHHESWDGYGYPDGLKGDKIPIEASILSLCDIYDLLCVTYNPQKAIYELQKLKGILFCEELINQFENLIKQEKLWTPEDFDEQKWLSIGIDILDMSKLVDLKTDYYELFFKVFAKVIDAKHQYTQGHSQRVAIITKLIAKKLGLPDEEVKELGRAAFLHDAGKVGIPDKILNKPSRLTDQEFNLIKGHPIMSYELIRTVSSLAHYAPIAKHHHERYDGTGYPDGLRGDNIPLGSRIIAIADTYDAITTDRSYRRALPDSFAREELKRFSGKMFDPYILPYFFSINAEQINKSISEELY